jgi:uncharacterized membrane protein
MLSLDSRSSEYASRNITAVSLTFPASGTVVQALFPSLLTSINVNKLAISLSILEANVFMVLKCSLYGSRGLVDEE